MPTIDARGVPSGATIETDVCVVGAGAAGCTLARELSGQPLHVCLIESGGLRMDPNTQSLAEGEITGDLADPLDETRVRGFGGTTAIWAGSCRPLDPRDFKVHEWVPFSGWPFSRAHLDPYYARAQAVCELGPARYDVDDWEDAEAPRLPLNPDQIATHIFQISPPTRFAKNYWEVIHRAPNVTTLLYGNVLEVETSDDARTASLVRVATLSGTRFNVRARLFVLAGGGIENPRLLLLSNRNKRVGLGNDHDLVGRFFMDHVRVESAELSLNDPSTDTRLYRVHRSRRGTGEIRVEGLLSVADAVLDKEHMLRCAFQVPPHWRSYAEFHSRGVMALRHVARAARAGQIPYKWPSRIRTILTEADAVALTLVRRLKELGSRRAELVLTTCSEQTPNPDSRVTLAESRDRFGLPRARLDWRLSEMDLWSIRRGNEILAAQMQASGLGRVTSLFDASGPSNGTRKLRGGFHQMGTTRIHSDPAQGVVDGDCRVHGMSNLFIAGASIFPTSGYANPTLTIVALSLRLADHIRALLC